MAGHCLIGVLLLMMVVADALVIDITSENGSIDALRTHICHVPVLGSTSEQMPTPNYQFSLDKGGTIEGTLTVTSMVEDNIPMHSMSRDDVLESLRKTFHNEHGSSKLKFRRRFKAGNSFQDHYNWVQLLKNVYNWAFRWGKDVYQTNKTGVTATGRKASKTLDNVYLILLSKAQFELYYTSDYEKHIEPAINTRQYVYNSHIAAEMRIPIASVGEPVTFSYKAKDTDRFALIIFNADERKLVFNGKVSFINPGNEHLPVEMKYYKDVITFWEMVYLATGLSSIVYLLVFCDGTVNVVNYMLALNFVAVALYLQLDRSLLSSIRETGTYSKILWTFAHLIRRLHEIYILTVLVLLALGWKILRDRLTEIEVRMVLSVAAFSSLVGFIEVLVNGIDISRYVVNTVSFIAILIATNFNTILIHSRVIDESLSIQAGMAYSLMKTYSMFRIAFFAFIFKPVLYSTVRGLCLQATAEQAFVWDEHFMLFLDLMFDYGVYCLYFVAFMPVSQLPLFKHLFETNSRYERCVQ